MKLWTLLVDLCEGKEKPAKTKKQVSPWLRSAHLTYDKSKALVTYVPDWDKCNTTEKYLKGGK